MVRSLIVDPGANAGLVIVEGRELVTFANILGKGDTWEARVHYTVRMIESYAIAFGIKNSYVEWPQVAFNARGNTESILKLAFLIGRLAEVLPGKMVLVPVNRWRGNCPKEINWKRAQKYFKEPELRNHAGDAGGIARWLIKNNLIKT